MIEIKSRFEDRVLFFAEVDSLKLCVEAAIKADAYLIGAYLPDANLTSAYLVGANLRGANLRDADLSGADLTGADLIGAYLTGANLRGANLTGAYLIGVDLRGANLRDADLSGADLTGAYQRDANLSGALFLINGEKITIVKIPLQILTGIYDVIIFDNHMRIGCEFHALKDWWAFDNDQIAKMDGKKARAFWDTWKRPLMAICAANERA